VGAFKRRVLKLVKLYIEKSLTLNPILDCFDQELFMKEPEMMNEIATEVLKRQGSIEKSRLSQLLQVYKTLLLYKPKTQHTNQYSETFMRLLRVLMDEDG
jgi:hypothetical protein